MGKPRKSNKQKSDAKRANAENMKFIENLHEQADIPDAQPKKKHNKLIEPIVPVEKVEVMQSVAIPMDLSLADRKVSVFEAVLANNVDTSMVLNEPILVETEPLENIAIVNVFNAEVMQETTNNLEKKVASLEEEKKALQVENGKLRVLNMKLQEAIIDKPVDASLTEIPGFPDAKWLLSVSQNAQESDYLFIKELVIHLFPDGVGNATVTGRPSDNPFGRGKTRELEHGSNNRDVVQLDPEKVDYIKGRLFERRRILQDPVGVALQTAKKCASHISTVIANNPSLRKLRVQ